MYMTGNQDEIIRLGNAKQLIRYWVYYYQIVMGAIRIEP